MNLQLTDLHLQTLTFLLQTGQKEEAIKYYSEAFHLSISQSTDAISQLEKEIKIYPSDSDSRQTSFGKVFLTNYHTDHSSAIKETSEGNHYKEQLLNTIKNYTDFKTEALLPHTDTSTQEFAINPSVEAIWHAVDDYLRHDKKADAIKIYQRTMDIDHQDAKNIIEERSFTVHPEPKPQIKGLSQVKISSDRLKAIVYWSIILTICYFLMKDFLLNITLVDVIRFFIQLFSF